MNLRILAALLFTVFLIACSKDKIYVDTPLDQILNSSLLRASPDGTVSHFILPDSDDYSNIPQDSHNPITAEKVRLGKMLFFETGIALESNKEAGKHTYSCASCHVPSAGFRPGN